MSKFHKISIKNAATQNAQKNYQAFRRTKQAKLLGKICQIPSINAKQTKNM